MANNGADIKKYKAGQIVTIRHHRYRIKKDEDGPRYCPSCDKCAFKNLHEKEYPCFSCLTVIGMIPSGCYFKLILK